MPHSAEAHVPRDAALAYYEDGPELAGVVLDALRESGREVDPIPTIWRGSTSSTGSAARRR